ncbi:ABC transporter permease subunit [Streptomyces antimycoticus]
MVLAHGLRNASLPTVTVIRLEFGGLFLEFGGLLGGAILTEQVFSWPGVGRLTVEAISHRTSRAIDPSTPLRGFIIVHKNLSNFPLRRHLIWRVCGSR